MRRGSLGFAQHHLGDHAAAAASFQQALDLFRKLGDRYQHALAQAHLGDTWQAAGDDAQARAVWQQALSTLDELGHSDADQIRANLHAQTRPANADRSPGNAGDDVEVVRGEGVVGRVDQV
jgi:tetratricopeptide (TPR) repeat protein